MKLIAIFFRSCTIEYEKVAVKDQVEVCRSRPADGCQGGRNTSCETVYTTECQTRQEFTDEIEEDVPSCKTEMEERCKEQTSGYTAKTTCLSVPKESNLITLRTLTLTTSSVHMND